MLDLTFGEQVKIILSRKNMTIKELAETIEKRTGKKMSRQNLTQRLGRDNFQEQDMRMIADILGCPFRLSILADSEEVERAASIADIGPTRSELNKLAKAKGKKEKKHRKERKEQISDSPGAERDMTIGELVDIHKELDDLMMETGKLPVMSEEDWKMSDQTRQETKLEVTEAKEPEEPKVTAAEEEPKAEELEATELNTAEELTEAEQQENLSQPQTQKEKEEQSRKKSKGWRAYLQKITHKEDEKENGVQERTLSNPDITELKAETEEDAEDDYIDYESSQIYSGEPEVMEYEELEDISEEDEDIQQGEINPDTGHEYETNSVRMHPKRIGYVQVYDRSDHRWTDMTEWAFLGYQERKKALLGKDYEPPIYLD